ncbi:MAG: F0F1 ATP synthase subunit A [Minisyncoccia bacterium]|jgi:F-type H+-transporting ATPase subunit a
MISLKPEVVFNIGNFHITNTYLASLIAMMFIVSFSIIFNKKIKEIPDKIQTLLEIIYEGFYNFWSNLTGVKNIKIFAFCFTFFIYILLSNWFGILPGFGSIYIKHHEEKAHLLRTTYSDLNMTLALGLISVIGANILGLIKLRFEFIKKFLNPIGLLELFSEISKILSFSLRLFGNILAGEILILSVSLLIPFLVPIPFMLLEIFVGFIQALIFFTLTSIFLKVAISHH